MKAHSLIRSAAFALLLSTLNPQPSTFAQGSLTPPGAPAPTMKTLDQIEPRTDVLRLASDASNLFIISQPGSYYLTTNLTGMLARNGISIQADNVTLDLNGFVVNGNGAGSVGITSTGARRNLTISNGSVVGWARAVSLDSATTCLFEAVHTSGNTDYGILAGARSLVKDCMAETNGLTATDLQTGPLSTIENCIVSGQYWGIVAGHGSLVKRCTAIGHSQFGIILGDGCTAQDCSTRQNSLGIQAQSSCRILNNTCVSNNGDGLRATGRANQIEGNLLTGNQNGLVVLSNANVVANNVVRDNSAFNYVFAQGNQITLLLCQVPEKIDWSATVVLAGSLTGVAGQSGISIAADDVTIDLAGHSLIGVPGSQTGISIVSGDHTNLVIRNGTIRDWGASAAALGNAANSQFRDLQVFRNGGGGLFAGGPGCQAENCLVQANANSALTLGSGAVVKNCTVITNTGIGIFVGSGSTVKDCTAVSNTGVGINAATGCSLIDCTANGNGGYGINAQDATTIRHCTCRQNTGGGIQVTYSSFVADNLCDLNGGIGIHAIYFHNRIENNLVTGNSGNGIQVDAGNNWIIKNSARNNSGASGNYGGIVGGNDVGPIGTAATATSPWANLNL